MGIPRFYTYVSERYPLINQTIYDASLLPEFDCFYLDMNGILHECTNSIAASSNSPSSFEEQLQAISKYIDRLVTFIVKPKKLVYFAIDGVAPRAKLNQQRSRRFRVGLQRMENAKLEALEKEKYGEHHSEGDQFDRNAITPGTEFLAKISEHLTYFFRYKVKNDPLWMHLDVYFSGSEVPGEGEHKIMDFIRQQKMAPNYEPNVRHCMYGSDADLILLSLMSHEPHFTLIRERVDFGSMGRKSTGRIEPSQMKKIREDQWQLVHMSLLREYLMLEMGVVRPDKGIKVIDTRLNGERMIDDFIFLTFLFGNDFIPHSPTLEIRENAIPLLIKVYCELLKKKSDIEYLTKNGVIINAPMLQELLDTIGGMEEEILLKRAEEEAKASRKKARYRRSGGAREEGAQQIGRDEGTELLELDEVVYAEEDFELKLAKALGDPADAEALDLYEDEQIVFLKTLSGSELFQDTKWNYYERKFGIRRADGEARNIELLRVKQHFVEALVWCLAYYFQGPPSWSWYYPHHYSPMISDLSDITSVLKNISFAPAGSDAASAFIDGPLLPFEQLMSNLPAASAHLVPKSYRFLMTSPQSPIKSFYPDTFEVDMEGKRNDWEGVNILPFIDIDRLRAAIQKHCPINQLTEAEKKRNRLQFHAIRIVYDPSATHSVKSNLTKSVFPDITPCYTRIEEFTDASVHATADRYGSYSSRLMSGVKLPLPGFPSLYSIPINGSRLEAIGINCFGFPSRKETTILQINSSHAADTVPLPEKSLGSKVYVNWPHLHEAIVVGVETEKGKLQTTKHHNTNKDVNDFEPSDDDARREWTRYVKGETYKHLRGRGRPGTGGIDLEPEGITCCLHVKLLEGVMKRANGSIAKKFGQQHVSVPYQLVRFAKITVEDSRFKESSPKPLEEQFPMNTTVMIVEGDSIGCTAIVKGTRGERVIVEERAIDPEPHFGYEVASQIQDKYLPGYEVAQYLGITVSTLGALAGSICIGDVDIGLKLHSHRKLVLPGYCRLIEIDGRDNRNKKNRQGNLRAGTTTQWRYGDVKILESDTRGGSDPRQSSNTNTRSFWEYSTRAVELLSSYRAEFGEVVHNLAKARMVEGRYVPSDLFRSTQKQHIEKRANEIADWIARRHLGKEEHCKYIPVSSLYVSVEAMRAIEAAGAIRAREQSTLGLSGSCKIRKKEYLASELFAPTAESQDLTGLETSRRASKNRGAPILGDRVVTLTTLGIPFGCRGTVVGTHVSTKCVEVLFDEPFLGGEPLYGTTSKNRGKIVPWNTLLCVSEPPMLLQEQMGLTRQIAAPYSQKQAQLRKPYENRTNNRSIPANQKQKTPNQKQSPSNKASEEVKAPPPPPSAQSLMKLMENWKVTPKGSKDAPAENPKLKPNAPAWIPTNKPNVVTHAPRLHVSAPPAPYPMPMMNPVIPCMPPPIPVGFRGPIPAPPFSQQMFVPAQPYSAPPRAHHMSAQIQRQSAGPVPVRAPRHHTLSTAQIPRPVRQVYQPRACVDTNPKPKTKSVLLSPAQLLTKNPSQ